MKVTIEIPDYCELVKDGVSIHAPTRGATRINMHTNKNRNEMKREQVLSVEQMQRLEKLGAMPSETLLTWCKQGIYLALIPAWMVNEKSFEFTIPACTLQDILDMLPKRIHEDVITYCLRMETDCKENKYSFSYTQVLEDSLYITGYNENPIDSAYELLLWCIEKGFVKAEGGGK